MVWKQCFAQFFGCYLWNLVPVQGALTMLCNAPHSTVIPLMLSEPPHVTPLRGRETLGGCWDCRQGTATLCRLWPPNPHTLSCGLRIRGEVYPGKCLTWIWDAGCRHYTDAFLWAWSRMNVALLSSSASCEPWEGLLVLILVCMLLNFLRANFFFCWLKLVSAFEANWKPV